MKAMELMNQNVLSCKYSDTAQHAATVMKQHDVGMLPVIEESGKLVGVITDRDLCLKVTAEGRDPAHIRVHECMTARPISCSLKDSSRNILVLMAKNQVRRIPVIDDQARLAGFVGIRDLIAHDATNARDIYLVLRRITASKQKGTARSARTAA
jgi:CBS domain-containing protein